jgi:molecular chaperone DnaK (HSP70)
MQRRLFSATLVLRMTGMPNPAERIANQQLEAARLHARVQKSSARFTIERVPDDADPGTFIGIDLGTSNSCMSYIDPVTQRPQVIPSPSGSWVFPTAITFDKNHTVRIFAEEARAVVRSSGSASLCSGKRLIGRRYGELGNVTSQMSKTNVLTINERGEVSVEVQGREYTVTHIMGMFLRHMKLMAEEYLQRPVTQAVVSVPAYFTKNQKVATEDAALIAGFDVLEIIDEPSAACLAHSVLRSAEKPSPQSGKLERSVVFDLGGGTLDCALMEHNAADGVFSLVATHGDPLLGGNDWDNVIAKHASDAFEKKWRIDLDAADVRPGQQIMEQRMLILEAEKCKVHFSHSLDDYNGYTRQFHFSEVKRDILPLETNVSFMDYLEITDPLRRRCIAALDKMFQACEVDPKSVDNVLLVGAMTRDPPVKKELEEYFGREASPSDECPADYAVAIGASVRAGMLKGLFPQLNGNAKFVRGSIQAQRSGVGMLSRAYNTAAASITTDNPNAVGHKYRSSGSKGLSNAEIERYAKELVEFDAASRRRIKLEEIEAEANAAMMRIQRDSMKRQGMQERRVKQMTDQVKFWQYMVRNFHDHEESLIKVTAELTQYMDEIEGELDDATEHLSPEGIIDFSEDRKRYQAHELTEDERAQRNSILSSIEKKEQEGLEAAMPPQDRKFMNLAGQQNREEHIAKRKTSTTKVLRREVPLPRTATTEQIVDKGSTVFLGQQNREFEMSESTRAEVFKEYVNDRAWREPAAPPGETESWGAVKEQLDEGIVVGAVVPARESTPVTMAMRLTDMQDGYTLFFNQEEADESTIVASMVVTHVPQAEAPQAEAKPAE